MNNTPLVSIIIPVYNGSNYLQESIECVLNQNYAFVECIVVNDGSLDNYASRNIALSYGDKIRYFEKNNGGVSSALNYGIKKMKGKYFTWLSHDDILDPNYISCQINYLISTQTKAVICRTGVINNKSEIISNYHNWNIPFFITDKPFISNMIWLYACSILVDKDFFKKSNDFSDKYKTCQDILFTYNVLYYVDCGFNKNMLSFRRNHQNNGVNNEDINTLNKSELVDMFKQIIQEKTIWFFFEKNNNKNYSLKKLFYFIFFFNSFKTFNQVDIIYKIYPRKKNILKLIFIFSNIFISILRFRNLLFKFLKIKLK